MSFFSEDIKSPFRFGNTIGQLMVINISIFLILVILHFILTVSGFSREEGLSNINKVIGWVAVPMDLRELLFKPWTFLTYMFIQFELGHIFWNMLILYFFGRIFQEFAGNKRVLPVYIYGGLAGAVLSLAAYHLIPTFKLYEPASYLLGASAGVMAIMLAAATMVPDYSVHLFILGEIRLKYIALFFIVVDMIGVSLFNNSGGHFSHIGGALTGYLFVTQLKKGRDLSSGFNSVLNKLKQLFRRRSKIKVVHKRSVSDEEYNLKRKVNQEEIDSILDKISTSGYESLTKQEKDILFKASNEK